MRSVVRTALLGTSVLAILCGALQAAPDGGRVNSRDYEEIIQSTAMSAEDVPERELVFVTAGGITERQRAELESLGIAVVSAIGGTVEVKGPLTAFAALGPGSQALPWVNSVLPSPYSEIADDPVPEVIATDALQEAIGANQLHERGFHGEGVNIVVLDLGFTGAVEAEYGQGQVSYLRLEPSPDGTEYALVEGLDSYGGGDHGEACARGILDIAPKAKLFLLSAPTINTRKEALRILADGELEVGDEVFQVDVLSDSTYCPYPFDHGDGRGEIALLGDAVVDGGVFYANALGNFARGEDTTTSFFGGTFEDEDGDGLLDLSPNADEPIDRNSVEFIVELDPLAVMFFGPASLALRLEWDGWPWLLRDEVPLEEWEPEDFIREQDLDLVVYRRDEATGGLVFVARSDAPQLKRSQDGGLVNPTEALELSISQGGTYLVSIENSTGMYPLAGAAERPVDVHLHVLSTASFSMPEHTLAGSFVNMGGAKKPVGVGAVEFTDQGWCVAPYSSRGPTSDWRIKPDLVAPTQYATAVPRYEPYFNGTSASAPIVAASAALLIEVARATNSPSDPATIRELLLRSATPICGSSWYSDGCSYLCQPMAFSPGDPDTGWGMANSHTGFGLVNVWEAYQVITDNSDD